MMKSLISAQEFTVPQTPVLPGKGQVVTPAQTSKTNEPQSRDNQSGRLGVLAAALTLFEQFGYHATSIRDIAAQGSLTIGAIYHHFDSKQEILQEIMETVLNDALAATRRALIVGGDSPSDQLSSLMRAWATFHCTRQAEARVGLSELRSLDPSGRRLIVALRDEQEAFFSDVVERGCREGDFTTAHPRTATRALLNMGSSIAIWFDSSGPLAPNQLAEEYVDLALGCVRAVAVELEG